MAPLETTDITLGELGRKVTDMGDAMRTGLKEVKDEVAKHPTKEALEHVRSGLSERIDALSGRVARSEAWGTWIGRLVGAAVALALLGNVIKPT